MLTRVRPRILFAIPTLRAGGAERVFSTLLRSFDTERFDVRLVLFDSRDAVFLSDMPAQIEVIDLGARRVRSGLRLFVQALHALQPDVVLSTLEHLNKALCATHPLWPRRVRHIIRLTNVLHLESWRACVMARILYPSANAIIYQSAAMRDAYEERLGRSFPKAVVIENPVDIAGIQRAAAEHVVGLAYPPNAINILAIGPFEPYKGFDLLVRAMAGSDPRLHLSILGDGPGRREFQDLVDSLGLNSRVHLKGVQANPYPFFRKADAFVLASRSEGSPNVVFEALACGTPVIATPVAGLDQFLDRIPGCYVAGAVSEDALTRVLGAFCDSSRQRSSPLAIAHQDAPAIVRRYEDLISSVIAAN